MDKKAKILILALLASALLLNIVMLGLLKERESITGLAVKSDDTTAFKEDIIELDKADLTECCSFTNSRGEEDSCYALKGRDCSYCSDYCS